MRKVLAWKRSRHRAATCCRVVADARDTLGRAARTSLLFVCALLTACADHAPVVVTSPVTVPSAAGMIDLHGTAPAIHIDMRYAGKDNFVGVPIDGYEATKCYLHRTVAQALRRVQQDLEREQGRLRVFDCYRPERAVRHFIRWANDSTDQKTKARYYPSMDKAQLLGDYIAPVSAHSRGATVDLSLDHCPQGPASCQPLDMGTVFDHFGPAAHTDAPQANAVQRANRQRLRTLMQRHGFENYALEWWHYTYRPEPTPTVQFDFPVR